MSINTVLVVINDLKNIRVLLEKAVCISYEQGVIDV